MELRESTEITEVPGGQRFSDEDFIQASDSKEAGLGDGLMQSPRPWEISLN